MGWSTVPNVTSRYKTTHTRAISTEHHAPMRDKTALGIWIPVGGFFVLLFIPFEAIYAPGGHEAATRLG